MNNGGRLPLVFMGGGTFCHSKTQRESSQPCTVLLFSSAPICTHGCQTAVRSETAAGMLPDAEGLCLDFVSLIPFFSLRDASKAPAEAERSVAVCDNKCRDDAPPLPASAERRGEGRVAAGCEALQRGHFAETQLIISTVKDKMSPTAKTAIKLRETQGEKNVSFILVLLKAC